MTVTADLLSLFLPDFLVSHFDLTTHTKDDKYLHLYFEEKATLPLDYPDLKLHSKGFHKEITVEDFPIRGLLVKLYIKRRRWIDTTSNKVIERNWDLLAKGTRFTKEFSSFLKELN